MSRTDLLEIDELPALSGEGNRESLQVLISLVPEESMGIARDQSTREIWLHQQLSAGIRA